MKYECNHRGEVKRLMKSWHGCIMTVECVLCGLSFNVAPKPYKDKYRWINEAIENYEKAEVLLR